MLLGAAEGWFDDSGRVWVGWSWGGVGVYAEVPDVCGRLCRGCYRGGDIGYGGDSLADVRYCVECGGAVRGCRMPRREVVGAGEALGPVTA